MLAPKKSLGQNFLSDTRKAARIVGLLDCGADDLVLEIGPGKGILTGLLLETQCRLAAVEIDSRALELLKVKFPSKKFERFELIKSDIRELNLEELRSKYPSCVNFHVIGNIPYNISGDILFLFLENANLIKRIVLTVQKEVALRICGRPGTKDNGILSLAVGLCGSAKKHFDVPPGAFFPKPKVTSSVVSVDFYEKQPDPETYHGFIRFIKTAFSQRRKMLRNSLKDLIENKTGMVINNFTREYGESTFTQRPEQLSLEEFMHLYNFVQSAAK